MTILWIIIGCLGLTGVGLRFVRKALGLTPAETTIVFVIITLLVGINTGPVRELLMKLI